MMRIVYRAVLCICIFLAIFTTWVPFWANDEKEHVVVGVYECAPYYWIDKNGNVVGFYDDLLKLLESKCNFDHTYKIGSFEENLEWLKNGDVDFVLGISITSDRLNNMIFSEQSIGTEYFSLYSKIGGFDILKSANQINLGIVNESTSAQFILNYFKVLGINTNIITGNNWSELEQLFEDGIVDVIPHSSSFKTDNSFKIYDFTGDQVYIAGNKNSRAILNQLDEAIIALHEEQNDPIEDLYNKYFGNPKEEQTKTVTLTILFVLLAILYFTVIIPRFHHYKIKKRIKENMQKNNYILQYQPIYNPTKNQIVGFEGLLRLMSDKKKLIPPLQFIPEIEKHGMLFDVSLWILQKAIQDYQQIKKYPCMQNNEFYISVNVSLNEIEHKRFTQKACKLLEESNIEPNKICLEIIERVKMEDIVNATQNLIDLKEAGFKIAIDDFGTEYSNFDLLLKLDIDVVKVDRSLVNGIDQDSLKKEVVNFISQIAKIKNKDVVLEGVELQSEVDAINNFKNERIFVQGYYYSKPIFKEEINVKAS